MSPITNFATQLNLEVVKIYRVEESAWRGTQQKYLMRLGENRTLPPFLAQSIMHSVEDKAGVAIGGGLGDPDIHDLAASMGQPKTVLATTPREVFSSVDAGESWQRLGVMRQFPYSYTRPIAVKEDNPQVMFVGHGQTASPTIGCVERSEDVGKTWETLPLPGEPNSYINYFATHPLDPNLVLASSLYGQLFYSGDGGGSWQKVRQEFSEVRSLAWAPN